jgi:hypothetical protein
MQGGGAYEPFVPGKACARGPGGCLPGFAVPACAIAHRNVERRRFFWTQERFSRLPTL